MENSKLIRTLSVLTKSDIEGLEKQLKGAFSFQKEPIGLLFQYLKKELSQKDIPNVEKESIFKKIFPKQTYHDGKMRKLMYELMQQIQVFMMAKSQEKPFVKAQIVLDFCHERYATKDYSEALTDLIQQWNDYPTKDILYWKTQAKIAEYKSYEMAMQYVFKDNMNVPNVIHFQTIVFFIQQLKQHFILLANQNLAKSTPIQAFFYQILTAIEANPEYLQIELLKAHYYIIVILLNKEKKGDFEALRQMILQHPAVLSITEWAHIAFALRNYASRKKITDDSFHQIYFDLYMEHLPLGFVFSNNHISPQSFINIIKIGLNLRAFDKVKMVFDDYQKYLPIALKENTLQLAEAYLLYEKREYQASLHKLLQIGKFEHYTFELDIRMLKIMNSCCLKDIDFCTQQIHAFKIFIYRNENMSEIKKEKYRNFAKFVQKYCEIYGQDIEQKISLYQEMQNCSMLVEKQWLAELLTA